MCWISSLMASYKENTNRRRQQANQMKARTKPQTDREQWITAQLRLVSKLDQIARKWLIVLYSELTNIMLWVSNKINCNTVQLQLILILIILFLLIITFPQLRSIFWWFEASASLLGITTVRCVISQKRANLLYQLFIYALTKKPNASTIPHG
jgi:hypothetical protein